MKQAHFISVWGLIFLITGWFFSARGQSIDQLDLYGAWQEEKEDWSWRAEYQALDLDDTLYLALYQGQVDSVFWREGRRKQALDFGHSREGVWRLALPAKRDPRAKVEIFYRLSWASLQSLGLEQGQSDYTSLRFPLDTVAPAYLFPRRSNIEGLYLRLHLLLPKDWEYGGDFNALFQVETGQGTAHYFEQKYLFPGYFVLHFGPRAALAKAQLAQLERQVEKKPDTVYAKPSSDYVAFIRKEAKPARLQQPALKPRRYELASRPKINQEQPQLSPGFFFYPDELPLEAQDEVLFAREQKLALRLHDYDTNAARRAHWQYYVESLGDEWAESLLARRYRLEQWDDPLFWEAYLSRYLATFDTSYNCLDSLSFEGDQLAQTASAALSTAAYLNRYRRPIILELRFRYHRPSGGIELIPQVSLEGEEALAVPITIYWQDQNEMHKRDTTINLRGGDTLRVATRGSPRTAFVSLPPFSAVELSEVRPESYFLYELVKGPGLERKQAALERLLETQNPNLLATVIGVALRGEDADLQIRALEKAPFLSQDGLLKLKNSLEQKAREASREELRLLARLALERLQD